MRKHSPRQPRYARPKRAHVLRLKAARNYWKVLKNRFKKRVVSRLQIGTDSIWIEAASCYDLIE